MRKSRRDQAAKLAAALVARGVPERNALVWEYYFPFGGPSRWTSALTQGTAAQALARSGALLDEPDLLARAEKAYRALRTGLSRELGGGLWVREYSFGDIAILNAQLQVLVSLIEYVGITGDEDARAFAAELDEASQALLSQFDTGCWSRYLLGGQQASQHYHDYHVALLKALAASSGDAGDGQPVGRLPAGAFGLRLQVSPAAIIRSLWGRPGFDVVGFPEELQAEVPGWPRKTTGNNASANKQNLALAA